MKTVQTKKAQKQLLIIAPLSALSRRTRLYKLANIAHDNNMGVAHWGWERKEGESDEDRLAFRLVEKKILLHGGGLGGRKVQAMYLLWFLKLFWALLTCKHPKTVYCLGFESAFPTWIISRFSKNLDYVYDDADRFSMLLKWPKPIKYILQFFEKKVSAASIYHIIPGLGRYDFRNDRQLIIRNTPNKAEYKEAMKENITKDNSKITIYINGWMGETRGLPIIYKVAESLSDIPQIHFISAGRTDGYFSQKFSKLPNVEHFGEVSNAKALSLYRRSDLVFTYYDPKIEINRYAESNKWGDGIFMGVPCLVNNEVGTADFLRKAKACFSFPYEDWQGLSSLLKTLTSNKEQLNEAQKALYGLRENMQYYSDEMKQVLKTKF